MKRRDLDHDVHRTDASAFGPDSVVDGGLLPYEGRAALTRPEGPPLDVLDATSDGWAAPGAPFLVRGAARIVPLAWRGIPADAKTVGADAWELAALASIMQAAGLHWAGNWRVLDLDAERNDSIGSYTAALRAAGATHVDCWTLSDAVGLALVCAGEEAAGTASLALHLVPAGWVSDRRAARPVPGIELHWSWGEVVELFSTRATPDP